MLASTRSLCRIFVPVLTLVVATGCQGMMGAQDEKKDAEARQSYYEQSAKTYYDGQRFDQSAIMWGKVLEERPDDQWAKFGQAKALHMAGKPAQLRQAEKILTEIMDLDWTHPTRGNVKFELQTTLASVYSDLADFYDRDVRMLEARLAKDPNADTRTLQCQIDTQKQKRNCLLQQSIPVWGQVLACSPDNPYALAGMAKAHLLAGTEEAGVRYAIRYLELSRQSQVQWRQKMCQWEKTAGKSVTEVQRAFFLEKIHGAREKEIGMRLLLASVYMRRETYQMAIQQYDEIMAMDPSIPATYVERAQAYAGMRMYAQAVKDLQEYLKITDPQTQRQARVNAADLLDRYKRLAGQGGFYKNPNDARTGAR